MPFDISAINFVSSLFTPSQLSSHLNLGVASGIAIFIGGKSAVSALTLRPLYGRPFHGWYNGPGCHVIVSELVRTLVQTPLSSEYSERLALSLGVCGKNLGPKYIALRTGTVMPQTSHLANMLVNGNCRGKEGDPVTIGLRCSPSPTKVTIINLKAVPTGNETLCPRSSRNYPTTIIPTATSIVACALCVTIEDWLAFAMILLGMVCSGSVSFILSTGKVTLCDQFKPATGVPPGDGMLLSYNHIVILRGSEEDVNAVTKGRLSLELTGGRYTLILCAFLAAMQVAAQPVIMPFASLPGQFIFLLSLIVSGVCNLYLSANEDDVRSNAIITLLNTPEVRTYQARSKASAAVMACLALCWDSCTLPTDILQELVPIKPRPWAAWSRCLAENIREQNTQFTYGRETNEKLHDEREKKFLTDLIDDAHAAYDQYVKDHDIV